MASNDSEPRPTNLLETIEHLEAVAFVPPKQRHTDAGQLAKSIASDAYEGGIPLLALRRLIKLTTARTQLDQGTTTTLAKNLYPLERVPSNVATQVVCCLGPTANKPSTATQALLLRWLVLVYDSLDDRAHLSKLYAVLFNYLDMISLRKPLCHLLSLITRRKHVKPFRIQALMELLRNAGGEEKELIGLLKVFKNYYPDIIVGDPSVSRRGGAFFKHPDPEWAAHLRHLQDTNVEILQADRPSSFQVVHRGAAKRSKMEAVVPDVQTSRVSHSHTSLEELRSVTHFVERIEKVELPNQIISALGDSLAQKYLFLVHPEAANRRLDDWLNGFLSDKLEYIQDGDGGDQEDLAYLLTLTVEYARYTKELPAAVISFLKRYLPSWNGSDYRDQILHVLEYLPLQSYESLRAEILDPIEAAVPDDAILGFYSCLIRQWGIKLRKLPADSEEFKPLSKVIAHAELLASSLLERQPAINASDSNVHAPEPATQSVLGFYSSLAELFSHAATNGAIRLTVPLAPTVYTLAFTQTNSVISLLGSILATYKSAFEASMTSEVLRPDPESLYPKALVGQFNGYVMDICNLLWRNRALNAEDPNAMGCLVPASGVDELSEYVRASNDISRDQGDDSAFRYTLPSVFSLSHHVALCNLSAARFAELEEGSSMREDQPRLNRPVTQKALSTLETEGGVKMSWQDYRVHMLDWLDAAGSRGTGDLMRSTMKALRREE